MFLSKHAIRASSPCWIAALALPIAGCMAYNKTTSDFERTPIVNTGTRATILYPGQGAPAMPGSQPPGTQLPPGTPPPYAPPGATGQPAPAGAGGQPPAPGVPQPPETAPQAQGSPQPGAAPDGQISFLGGSRMDESRHVDIRREPLLVKYLTAPFKLAAAPFVLAKEAL